MTIAEILTLPSGTKGEPFHATVQFVNARKSPTAAQHLKISDHTGSVKLVLWKRPDVYDSMKGKPVLIAGYTAKDNTYQGNTTREVHLNPDGSFDESQGSESPAPQRSEPAPAKVNGYNRDNEDKKAAGQRAGMCVKAAIDILIAGYHKGDYSLDFFGSPEFGPALKRIASDVCRVSEDMEAHKLSPSAKEREALTAGEDKVVKVAREMFTNEQEPLDQ